MKLNFNKKIDFGWFEVQYTLIPYAYLAKFVKKEKLLDDKDEIYIFKNYEEMENYFKKIKGE